MYLTWLTAWGLSTVRSATCGDAPWLVRFHALIGSSTVAVWRSSGGCGPGRERRRCRSRSTPVGVSGSSSTSGPRTPRPSSGFCCSEHAICSRTMRRGAGPAGDAGPAGGAAGERRRVSPGSSVAPQRRPPAVTALAGSWPRTPGCCSGRWRACMPTWGSTRWATRCSGTWSSRDLPITYVRTSGVGSVEPTLLSSPSHFAACRDDPPAAAATTRRAPAARPRARPRR